VSSIISAFKFFERRGTRRRETWKTCAEQSHGEKIPRGASLGKRRRKRERTIERERVREPPLDLGEKRRDKTDVQTDGGPVILNGRHGRFLGY